MSTDPTTLDGVPPAPETVSYSVGQHLFCHNCGAELEVTSECPCDPPEMSLRCCDQAFRASAGEVPTETAEIDVPAVVQDVAFDSELSPLRSGQRLSCTSCGFEVKLVFPTRSRRPRQQFLCCGRDMVPDTPAET